MITAVTSFFIFKRVHSFMLGVNKDKIDRQHENNVKELTREHYFETEEKIKIVEKLMKVKAAKSLKRSKEVLNGQSVEQIVPYIDDFKYYPGDARFMGAPIDMIIFDGATNDNIKEIIFLEIKTGKSRLTKRQQQIKELIKQGKVRWEEFRVKTKPVQLKHKKDLAKIDECLCPDCVPI